MRFLFAGLLALVLSSPAHGQARQDIGAWLAGQPVATVLNPTDILFVYQGGVDKQIPGSAFGTTLLSSNNTWTGTNAFGVVTAPTATFGDSSTLVATTAFVQANAGGSLINNAPPFTTFCNPTGVTAVGQWCAAITAVAPLGISGSTINVNTATTTALLMGGAGNGGVTSTTSVGIGGSALVALTSGNGNFALGNSALSGITSGTNNIGIGVNAGAGLGAGGTVSSNILIGSSVMGAATTTAQFNVAIGASALTAYTGSNSTVIGTSAGLSQTSGNQNTYVGVNAGRGVTTGGNNSVFGNCGTSLPSGLTGSVMLCDGNSNVRYDWGFTTASTTTLAAPVVVGGNISANSFRSTGTVPTGNTGTCSTGVTVAGGATAGTWTSTAVCALAGTIILTGMPTQTTGYACFVSDRTTAGVVIEQTATTVTSASFVVRSLPTGTVATVANDILQYSCTGY